jgi:hypothetical protein
MQEQLPAEARTVEGIRRLMKELSEALDALVEGVSIAAPDTVRSLLSARQEIVPIIDDRLTRAAELIRRGLRDEAMSYASDPPKLVEAATFLDISGNSRWKTWSAKLAELNIPTPRMPRMDLVAEIIKSQEDLVRLKPRLDAWRRMNLANAPLPHRITMLKTLRQEDPENEVWFEALHEHEKQRIPEIEREVAAAARTEDDNRLSTLVAEIEQDWIEPVPVRLIQAAKSALETFRNTRIDRELDTAADSLAAAHEAKDLAAAQTLWHRWEELVAEKGSFAVDDSRLATAGPAVEWVESHDRLTRVSEEIWNSLDARPGSLRTRQDWVRDLERLGNEMEDLAEKLDGDADDEAIERAHERIGRQRLQLERDIRFRRMLMYTGIASTAIVLGVMVWYFDDRARYQQSVAAAMADLDAAREQIAAGTLQTLPAFEQDWPPRILGNTRVSTLLTMARAELEQEDDRRVRLVAALEGVQENLKAAETSARPEPVSVWPDAFAKASRAIAEIETAKLAKTDQERADTQRLKGAIGRLAQKLVNEADDHCRTQIKLFDSRLEEARKLVATDASAAFAVLEEVRTAIDALHTRAAAAAAREASPGHARLRVASEPIVALLASNGPLRIKADSIDSMLADRKNFRARVRELDRLLGDWKSYAKQLTTISREFSQFPEAHDYGQAAESQQQWAAIEEWDAFLPWLKGLDIASPELAKKIVAEYETLSVAAKALPEAEQLEKNILPSIKQLAARNLPNLRAELEKFISDTWVGELRFVVSDTDGREYYCLAPPKPGAQNFTYVSGSKDQVTGWPEAKTRKPIAKVEQSPQAKLAERLRRIIQKFPIGGIAVDELFVSLTDEVVAADDMDPFPRLVTARKFVELALDSSLPWQKTAKPLAARLFDNGGGIPGIELDQIWSFVPPEREENLEYKLGRPKAESLLTRVQQLVPNVRTAIKEERTLLTAVPTESMSLVGRLDRDDAGTITVVWKGKPPPAGAVWWFPPGRACVVAGKVDTNFVFHPEAVTGPAGTPLFIKKQ